MMDNKFWMNVLAVIVAMLLMSWVVRPFLGGVLGVKEGMVSVKRKNYNNSTGGILPAMVPVWQSGVQQK